MFLSSLGFEQVEAITYVGVNRYFITSEAIRIPFISDYAKLISFTTSDKELPIKKQNMEVEYVYPNPTNEIIDLNIPDFASVEIYDASSKLVYRGYNQRIDVSEFTSGFYSMKIYLKNNTHVFKKMIKN